MVVVDVCKLSILDGVKLNRKDVVVRTAIVCGIEKPQKLDWKCFSEIFTWSDEESKAMPPNVAKRGEDTEYKGDREGLHHAIGGLMEAQRRRVNCMTLNPSRIIRQLDEACRCDPGCAIDGEVAASEAIVDELFMVIGTDEFWNEPYN